MADNPVPKGDEIQNPGGAEEKDKPNPLQEQYLRTQDRSTSDRQTVTFTPQDANGLVLDKGYDARFGYDRIAAGNSALSQRIDNITNLLAAGERATGNLRDVNQYYGKAQNMADSLFVEASTNIMQRREDFKKVLAAATPQEALSLVAESVNKQGQALIAERAQTQDQRRQQQLDKLIVMAQERAQNLERLKTVTNPQEFNRLVMYDALSAQRIDLKRGILNERNVDEARKMTEAELNLHTIQRAPGFTRANYGMLMMRMGQFDPSRPDNGALRALQDAASVDPEMVPNPNHPDPMRKIGDPNFMRAVADITGMRADDPRLQNALAPIFNRTDVNRVPQPIYRPEANGGVPLMDGTGNVRYSQTDRQPQQPGLEGARQNDQTTVTDQARQGVTVLVNGATPYERVQDLTKRIPKEGFTDQIKSEFVKAIDDSDKGTSPRVAEIQQLLGQYEQKGKQVLTQMKAIIDNPGPEIAALDAQSKKTMESKTPEQKAEFDKLKASLDSSKTKEEYDAVLAKIGAINPEFVKKTQMLDEKLAPGRAELEKIQAEAKPFINALFGEMNQSAETRRQFAEQLIAGGKPEDLAAAKQLLIESVAKALPEQKEDFKNYALRMGVTEQELGGSAATVAPEGEMSATSKAIEANRAALDAAPDKVAALAQLDAQFKAAIASADKDFNDAETQFKAAQTRIAELSPSVPKADQDKFVKMNDAATSEADRAALVTELGTKYPEIVQLQAKILEIGSKAEDLSMNKFEARYDYARANSLAGKDDVAKPILEEGLKAVSQEVRPEILARILGDQEFSDLSKKLGIDAAALSKQSAETAATGENPDVLIKKANDLMAKGDAAGAKAAFEQAIKVVDNAISPERYNATIKRAQDALKSNTLDGKTLTLDDRVALHEEISNAFLEARAPYQVRREYGFFLARNNQDKDAEAVFKAAAVEADKIPVDAMNVHSKDLIVKDILAVQAAKENASPQDEAKLKAYDEKLSAFANALMGQVDGPGTAADKSIINAPISARKDLAAFYVRLKEVRDENNQPVLNPDGTPKFRADASEVFHPEEGMKAIDEAKALHKKIYGTDLDKDPAKDPGLVALGKSMYQLSPAELKRQYDNNSRFWQEAVIAAPTGIVGTGTAILTAAALTAVSAKFKGFAELPALARTAAIWVPSVATGTLAAGVTRHELMTQGFGRTDETWTKSMSLGFGATAGGLALMKGPQLWHAGLKSEGVTAMLAKNGIADDVIATQLFNKGLGASKQVSSLTEAMAGWSGSQRAAAAQKVLETAQKESAALNLIKSSGQMSEALSTKGLQVSETLAANLESAGMTINRAEGLASVPINTVDDLYKVLPRLAESNPALFNAKNSADALVNAKKMLAPFADDIGKSITDVMAATAKTGVADVEKLAVLRQLVPEAAAPGRFAGVRQMIAERRIIGALAETAKGTGNLALDGVKGAGGKAKEFVVSPFRSFQNQTAAGLDRQRIIAAAGGGAGYYAGDNYSKAWYDIGSGAIDPSTNKPYEFSFNNAVFKPAYKSPTDNIVASSLLTSAIFGLGRPGVSVVGKAPWNTEYGKLGNIGSTLLSPLDGRLAVYAGSRFGEVPAGLATNFAFGQISAFGSVSNYLEDARYKEPLDNMNKPIVNGKTPFELSKGDPAPKAEESKPGQPVKEPAAVPNANPGPENTDLTGGVK